MKQDSLLRVLAVATTAALLLPWTTATSFWLLSVEKSWLDTLDFIPFPAILAWIPYSFYSAYMIIGRPTRLSAIVPWVCLGLTWFLVKQNQALSEEENSVLHTFLFVFGGLKWEPASGAFLHLCGTCAVSAVSFAMAAKK